MSDSAPIPLLAEVRALLTEKGVNEYQLRKAGIGAQTARKALGKAPGAVSAEGLDAILALVGRELWHRKRS
jgi:hypothetical protein